MEDRVSTVQVMDSQELFDAILQRSDGYAFLVGALRLLTIHYEIGLPWVRRSAGNLTGPPRDQYIRWFLLLNGMSNKVLIVEEQPEYKECPMCPGGSSTEHHRRLLHNFCPVCGAKAILKPGGWFYSKARSELPDIGPFGTLEEAKKGAEQAFAEQFNTIFLEGSIDTLRLKKQSP